MPRCTLVRERRYGPLSRRYGLFRIIRPSSHHRRRYPTTHAELLLWLYKLTSQARGDEDRAKTLSEVKQVIESKRPELDALEGVMDTCVHSTYYQLATEVSPASPRLLA